MANNCDSGCDRIAATTWEGVQIGRHYEKVLTANRSGDPCPLSLSFRSSSLKLSLSATFEIGGLPPPPPTKQPLLPTNDGTQRECDDYSRALLKSRTRSYRTRVNVGDGHSSIAENNNVFEIDPKIRDGDGTEHLEVLWFGLTLIHQVPPRRWSPLRTTTPPRVQISDSNLPVFCFIPLRRPTLLGRPCIRKARPFNSTPNYRDGSGLSKRWQKVVGKLRDLRRDYQVAYAKRLRARTGKIPVPVRH